VAEQDNGRQKNRLKEEEMLHSHSSTGGQVTHSLGAAGSKLVVIGGDAAGMSAASQARRGRPDLQVVAFERGPYTSYAA